jgi:hypothetical protein
MGIFMKPQKRQKKYLSREMIIKDIDAAIRRRDRLNRQAECDDAEANLLALAEEAENVEEIRKLREGAEEKRGKAVRINETRLQKLKQTLSAFQSEPLPGFDHQVVLQAK